MEKNFEMFINQFKIKSPRKSKTILMELPHENEFQESVTVS